MVEPETSTQVSSDFSGVIEVRLSTSSGEDSFRITLGRTPVLPFNLSSYFFPFFIFSGLTHGVKLLKRVEGQFNKAFILTMSSGDEIVARLPYPNAGPAFYTITSEIATRNFLRDVLGIPIPRVYAWSAEASNPVERLEVVSQIVALEKKLASISFPKHGCIYYESDLKSRSLIYERLDILEGLASVSSLCHKSELPGFVIGPSTNPRLWEGKRATMNIDRGPWNNAADYATAIGKNELEWATSYAEPRLNYHRPLEHFETPDDYISLIKRYITIASYLVSTSMDTEQTNRISHPDLHLDNIFIDPKTNKITCIIDWQHVSASPRILQKLYPQMLEISAAEQSDQYKHEKMLLDHYCDAVKEAGPKHWKVLCEPHLTIRIDPIFLVPGCWDREDLFSLRNALITAVARWDNINHHKNPCPVNLTDEELLQHQNEMELIKGISAVMHQLQDEGLIPLGGMVRPQYYERAKELNNIC
ncbi:kinase-like domain-containing protein [Aspergillus alliaceus]|uniref:Kinase-like domain-containing protein n=1 Tax=Petromyces alliaceus TaxID=209559 RepID=A0A5N7C5Y9_PETAA|nr:kinase-like domain-containing protein [Aspergillus alliaceus]